MARLRDKRTSNRAVAYLRVSTERQVEEGHSLDAQRKAVQRWCDNHGIELEKVYADEGLGGAKKDRPGFARMLADVLADGYSHVVCTRVDRLSRSVNDLYSTKTALEAAGVDLVFTEQGLDGSTAIGKAMLGMLGVFAELERSMLSERTRIGMAEAKEKGIKLGPKPQLDPALRERIEKMHAEGGSYNGIATTLNKEGIPTAGKGQAWYPSTIRYIITKQRWD